MIEIAVETIFHSPAVTSALIVSFLVILLVHYFKQRQYVNTPFLKLQANRDKQMKPANLLLHGYHHMRLKDTALWLLLVQE
jgi:hypothetical protein